MSDQISKLGIEIDTRSTVQASQRLDAFGRSAGGAEKATQRLQTATERMERQMASMQRMVGGIGAAIGGAISVTQIIRWGDAWTSASNQIRLVTNSVSELAAVQKDVYEISQRTASRLEATAGLYSSIERAAGASIGSQKEVLRLTETIAKLTAAGGGPESSRNAALFQLRQALGGAVLQAQEFNSLIDGAPLLVDAIAKGFGKTRSEFKKLVNDGKADIPTVIKALQDYGAEADKIFSKVQFTVGDAMVRFDNAMQKLVGTIGAGPILALSNAISELANKLDSVTTAATIAGAALLGGIAGRAVVAGVGFLAGEIGLVATAGWAATASAKALGAALAFAGGWAGLALTAAAAGLAAYAAATSDGAIKLGAQRKVEADLADVQERRSELVKKLTAATGEEAKATERAIANLDLELPKLIEHNRGLLEAAKAELALAKARSARIDASNPELPTGTLLAAGEEDRIKKIQAELDALTSHLPTVDIKLDIEEPLSKIDTKETTKAVQKQIDTYNEMFASAKRAADVAGGAKTLDALNDQLDVAAAGSPARTISAHL